MPDVESADLKPAQRAKLLADLTRQLRYLNQLCARMRALKFPPAEPLCQEASRARAAMQALVDALRP